MRLGAQSFRIVTGAADGARDATWISAHLPGDAFMCDVTSAWSTIGLWGPRAGEVLSAALDEGERWATGARPFGTFSTVEIGGSVVLASRISYVGEFGWELHVPADQAGHLWDRLWAAGQHTPSAGLVPVGIGVYGTTARLEKGYRAFGAELTPEYNLVEAGMARPRVKSEWFIGKDVYLAQRSAPPAAVLATLTMDSLASADGTPRYALGGEPILAPGGSRLVDSRARPSYVTSAGTGRQSGRTC